MCLNNFSDAYQNFKKAVEADPTNTSVRYILKWLLFYESERNVNQLIPVSSVTGCQQYGCLFPISRETDGCFEDPGSLGSWGSSEESTWGGVV